MTDACHAGLDIGFASLSYLQIGLLGLIQGMTELLPISSTAHMRIIPAIFGWPDPGSAFSAVMQLAALIAVVSYFRRDVGMIASGTLHAWRRRDFHAPQFRLTIAIIVATIPIAIVGLLLSPILNSCMSPLRSLSVIGYACIIMAILMALAEQLCRHHRTVETMQLRDAWIVGIAQVAALIPGASRSGSTLTAALFLNFKREEAARFSFLLGLPTIALAGLKELIVLWQAHLPLQAWLLLLFGLIVASGTAFCAIWGLMKFLERFSTWLFIIYRAVLGLLLLVVIN